jgi:hypothetical protein
MKPSFLLSKIPMRKTWQSSVILASVSLALMCRLGLIDFVYQWLSFFLFKRFKSLQRSNCISTIGKIPPYPGILGLGASSDTMRRSPAPETVQAWIAQPPAWLDVQPIENQPDVGLIDLDLGE